VRVVLDKRCSQRRSWLAVAVDHAPHSTRTREHAERVLIMRMLDIVLHELGNPLQGLTLQIELTRSTLAAQSESGVRPRAQHSDEVLARGLDRLDRALESLDHAQDIVHRAAALRRLLDDARDIDCDESCTGIVGLLGPWLVRRRVEVVRIEPEDQQRWRLPLPLEVRMVLLGLLLATGDLLRDRAGAGARLELCPRIDLSRGSAPEVDEESGELELSLHSHDASVIAIPIAPILRANDLLGERGELVHERERVLLRWRARG
jgi:hypothetical protein